MTKTWLKRALLALALAIPAVAYAATLDDTDPTECPFPCKNCPFGKK